MELKLRLNKKETKVLLDKRIYLFGGLGTIVQVGLPFAYVATTYGLFIDGDLRNKLSGWGIVAFSILAFSLRKKTTEFIKEYNALGVTAKRANAGHIFLTIFIVLAISSYFVNAFLWLFGVLTVSNYLSLPLYRPYDLQKEEQKRLNEELKKQKTTTSLSSLIKEKHNKGKALL